MLRTPLAVAVLLHTACTVAGPIDGTTGGGGDRAEGASCTAASECRSGQCPAVPNEPRVCRAPCTANGACGADLACVTVDGSAVCLPLLETRMAGESCEGPRQCSSGVCAPLGAGQTGATCAGPCAADGTCQGAGMLRCAVDARVGGNPACMTTLGSLDDGQSCTNGRQCTGGRCVPWGGALMCATGCQVCAGTALCVDNATYGQACLEPLSAGAPCGGNGECASASCYAADGGALCVDGCGVDMACPASQACLTLQPSAQQRCVPLAETRADGQGCTRPDQCQSGRCARFAAGTFDGGTLCAAPCQLGMCNPPQVCWGAMPDAGMRGLCGPALP